MKNVLKGILTCLMSLAVVAAAFMIGSPVHAAAGMDTMGSAKTLSLNGSASQKLTSRSDEDWYKFTITETGCFSLVIGPSASSNTKDIKSGWHCEVMDANRNVLQKELYVETTESFYKLSLVPGTYYIRVYSPYTVSNAYYTVKPTFVYNDKWISDQYGTDTERSIDLNTTYYGNMLNYKDVDIFKFTIPRNGCFTMSLGPTDYSRTDTIKSGWHYKIKDADGNTFWHCDYVKTNHSTRTLSMVPGTYYAVISSPSTASLADYNIRINFTEDDSWIADTYNGDTYKNVQFDQVYRGRTLNRNDNDYFTVTVPSDGYVSFTLNPDASSNSEDIRSGWHYEILDSARNRLEEKLYVKTSWTTEKRRVTPGTYYFRVYSPYTCSDSIYNFSAHFTPEVKPVPAEPQITEPKKQETVTPQVVVKKANTLSVKGKTVVVKKSQLKKKSVSVKRARAIAVKKAVGKVSYKKLSGNKKIKINRKSGKMKVGKGLKKGTYKVKVKVTAAGNSLYKKASKKVVVKIRVK